MNHTDNLSNPRVYYSDGLWKTTYTTPTATQAIEMLNSSSQTKAFVQELSEFANINPKDLQIPTTKSGLKQPNAIPLQTMKAFFSQPDKTRYILNQPNINLGETVIAHYLHGKAEPTHYLQAGDDFYRISDTDPFNLGSTIPLLSGYGDFKVRVATRSLFYEIQAEIKITQLPPSPYSIKPGSNKINPFLK